MSQQINVASGGQVVNIEVMADGTYAVSCLAHLGFWRVREINASALRCVKCRSRHEPSVPQPQHAA